MPEPDEGGAVGAVEADESTALRELVDLDGGAPGRIQAMRVPKEGKRVDWHIIATYGWADRLLAVCAYERDAIALGRSLADALGPDCHFDLIR